MSWGVFILFVLGLIGIVLVVRGVCAWYVASATAGGIAPVADITTGWYTNVILVAKTTTVAAFRARGHTSNAPATAP